MKTLILASALVTVPALAEGAPIESVVQVTSSQVQEISPAKTILDNEGIQITIILGSLLLGSGLGSLAYAEYEKKVPPEKRIGARVLRLLGERDKY